MPLDASANCVVVMGKRAGDERIAACVVRADTRADVNTVVRKALDVRKCSFLDHDRAVEETGMEYGGITPIGLPDGWRLLVDELDHRDRPRDHRQRHPRIEAVRARTTPRRAAGCRGRARSGPLIPLRPTTLVAGVNRFEKGVANLSHLEV